MSIVVETSVIISVITNEKSKSNLIKITQGEDLIAPSSLHWEVGNAVSSMFKRDIITFSLAEKAIKYYRKSFQYEKKPLPETYYKTARMYEKLADLENAKMYYIKALQLDPYYQDAETRLDSLEKL